MNDLIWHKRTENDQLGYESGLVFTIWVAVY